MKFEKDFFGCQFFAVNLHGCQAIVFFAGYWDEIDENLFCFSELLRGLAFSSLIRLISLVLKETLSQTLSTML